MEVQQPWMVKILPLQFFQLCHHGQIKYPLIVLSFQYNNLGKKGSIYMKANEPLSYLLVTQTSI
jgi:hypothetical protein